VTSQNKQNLQSQQGTEDPDPPSLDKSSSGILKLANVATPLYSQSKNREGEQENKKKHTNEKY
jgi:hypothetical protein